MSTTAAAVTVVVFLVVGLTAVHWVICRLRGAASTRGRLIREAHERAGLPPAAPDNEAGTNTAWADECALIYSLPAHGEELGPPPSPDPMEAGLDRLRDAIRNDHTEGDQ
ncbi:hypothetical protein ACGFNY_04875 [Streptomyces chartreusis]|uniref:hypothetical protein n=1 Tax=Streptomyces chartreusis TaxID=1969 RepID=UPI003721DA77